MNSHDGPGPAGIALTARLGKPPRTGQHMPQPQLIPGEPTRPPRVRLGARIPATAASRLGRRHAVEIPSQRTGDPWAREVFRRGVAWGIGHVP